ncbi:aminomethyl-transferring glycine dehydrogenase subunit GcvPA [Parendozoicomonas haliclonae]|uniref:Putative glycine dehydrogenase (Decarboxylating) subunit 1 n=1 Tax=Parendozoicomonas haliclonae TaxID=1960125 RepID=A0A1X7AGN2_9GAMM|nr:aminomethyl-transferring glycine dehydrogenase subunit GcvPA [Parendozoicomonas haliclonae]SMA40356.1 putative glycine dehydrogenase (decarboxylating) subunit 1 [Parendozoicomonas haliclonae]
MSTTQKKTVYPYIPNSTPQARQFMLDAVNAKSVDEFYADIPKHLKLDGLLDLPAPKLSEFGLKRHVQKLLNKNTSTEDNLSFLGGGCYQHHVPSVCDEVNQRSEFVTAYAGEPYDDHGRFQALFEYTSLMGELLEMDVVNVPVYDGFQAAATSIRMACRYTGKRKALISGAINPDKLKMITTYCQADVDIHVIPVDQKTGGLCRASLKDLLDDQTAVVYFDNPNYLGVIEDGEAICSLANEAGAVPAVAVDPISLGVLAPPANYGAKLVTGDIQPLGMHMQFGGGHAGFIASHDEPDMVMQYPSRLFGIAPTEVPGEYGFGDVAFERTSFEKRENGQEYVGTAAVLWGITAGVYLATMGPQGMQEIGEGILQRNCYAKQQLSKLPGVNVPHFDQPHFKEFVVNFDDTGKTVAEINLALQEKGIFAGHDLSADWPELGQSALYCFTEVHTQNDIDTLCQALTEVL